MDLSKRDDFLKTVISFIKFPFDREDIKEELEGHILDKIDFYLEEGHELEEAENLAIKDMGDPEEIGKDLNKEHNPIIGWIWKITGTLVKLIIAGNILSLILMLIPLAFMSIFPNNPLRDIPKKEIVYKMSLNEKVQIDDRVIRFTDLAYDKSGTIHLAYNYYEKRIDLAGWSLSDIGTIKDEKGNEYYSGGGSDYSGLIRKARTSKSNFPKEAKMLIIDFDRYNRKYKIEIPLKGADDSE